MTIFGWDASHYDAVPSPARVVADGISFFTHKAGGDAPDAELGAWWSSVRGYRDQMLLGAYWVLRRTDGIMSAKAFLARLDSLCPTWRDGPFILQLDCESWSGGSVPAPTKAQIKACADHLVDRVPKLRPIVYAPKWVYGDSLTGLGYPLWASSYVTGSGSPQRLYPGDSSARWNAYSGQVPAILQYSSSAIIAGQTTCDANAYRGTLAELTALLAPGWIGSVSDDMTIDLSQVVPDGQYATKRANGIALGAFIADQENLRDFLTDAEGTPVPGNLGGFASGYPADDSDARIALLCARVKAIAAKVDTLSTGATIPQAQLDLAVLNALKTLAGGQA